MTEQEWIYEQIEYLDSDCYLAQITEPPSKLPIFLVGYVLGIGAGFFYRFVWGWLR